MAHAHGLGGQEATESHAGLHDHILQRQGLLWLRCGPSHELRARLAPPAARAHAARRTIFQRQARTHPEWVLGA